MIRNLKRKALRTVSAALSLAVTASAIPLQAYAEELIPDDVYIQEVTLTDEILTSDVFYLTAPNAQLSEGANERYYLRVGRGGDVLSAASVNVKIADLTAKYGEDYEIYVLDEDAEVDNPASNESLLEMMEGEEYDETPIVEEDEFSEMVNEDAALQQSAQQAVNDSIEYIEEAAGLTPAESADGSETVNVDPLQQARAMFTGIEGEAQNVTASQDTFMEIQEIADVLTTAVVGANLKVDFDEGEASKYIVIDVEDNSEGDGDRYFYLMLSDPSGTTTISSASSCALTIMDDEEQLPSEVSFGECTFNDAYDTLTVEIKRSGSINQIADVQLVSEGITAQIGRDFSAVDMSVAFPMGIDTRTIDIPICTDYITADAEFVLKLSNNVGANVITAEKSIIIPNIIMPDEITNEILASTEISNTVPGSAEYYAAENKRTLGTVTLDKAINLSSYAYRSNDGHYTGYNGMDGNNWRMMWQGGDGWTRFWHNYKGSVGTEWKMSAYEGFEYAGAQVKWSKSKNCAHINVGFEGFGGWSSSTACSLAHGAVYSSNNSLSNTVTNIFSNITDPVYINIYNRGNCDDCNSLYVHSITPIKRPFVVKLIEADKLKFLQADGSYKTDDGTATYLAISGAENNDATQSVIHYAEETVTFMQTVGKNISTPYTYLKQLKTKDGFEFANFKNTGSTQYTKKLTTKYIKDNSTWDNKKMIKYYKNSQMKNSNANSGNEYGMYGEIELKPTFDYKNATVKVIVPANSKYGYLNISGTDRNISNSTEYTYHLGDTLQLSTKMYDEYSKVYEPVGFEVKYKKNKSDSKWVETKTVKYKDGKEYLDANQRLRYGYYEVTPIFQTKGNVITVRVAESDLSKFDTTYGLFATKMVNSTTISGKKYKEYIVYNDVVASKIYSLTVKSTTANVYPVWKAINENNSYSGEVFYHEADSNKANNVIVLSTETFKDTYDYYHSMSGCILSRVFNMQTGEIDESTMTAHEGAIVAAGESFAIAGKDGSFKVSSIRAVPGKTIRYLVTVNGEILIKEKNLGSKNKASVQTINLLDGTSKKVKVISNDIGNVFINTENGSILSNIEVWVEDMNNAGYTITVDPESSIIVRAQCNSPDDYKKTVNNNGVVSEVDAKENMTAATFVVYGSDKKIKEEYRAVVPISAFEKIEAENYSAKSGIEFENCSEGGSNIGYISNGDYVMYEAVNFGGGATSFTARVASATNGGKIELYLDSLSGTPVATCNVSRTGDWQKWVDAKINISKITGTHDLYLKFTGGSGDLFNINNFVFSPSVKKIEAESYNSQKGLTTQTCSEGTNNICNIENGDYVVYNSVDFGDGYGKFTARVASATNGGNIEVYLDNLDSEPIATCSVANTGGWQTWVNVESDIPATKGTHNLYLKFTGGSGYLLNVNYFSLSTSFPTTPEVKAVIPMEKISPGDSLYIRVETDKAMSGMPGENMVYSDAYTSYMFVEDTTGEVPPIEASIQPVTNMSFIELPLLGDSGFNFDFPFVSVSAEKTDTGYRMSIGVSPLQIADKVKGSNLTSYDDRTGIKDIFSIKHPFDTFKQGIKESANLIGGFTDVAKKSVDAAKQAASAIGAPTWKFDVQFGAYFEFNYVELTNPNNGAIYTDTVFTGVGGYIGISGGVKLTWYTVLPVVYLPAYFGIEISAEMLGYFGAGTDPTKPIITYKDANNATVKYEDTLGEFDMSIQMAAKVQVYVGIGLCGLLGLRGGGTVEVMGQYEPSEIVSDWGAQITFTAGIWIDLFLFSVPLQYTFPQINFGSFKEYADAALKVEKNVSAYSNLTLRAPYSDAESEWVPSENNASASTGNGMSNVLPGTPDLLAGFSETSNYTLVENAYEHPEVQLLKLSDGSVFMAFLDTDSSRTESERTVLKYAVYSNDKWSDPVVVADDGTADFQPSICEMDNSRVMITWLSSDPEKQISEEAEDYLTSLEVYTAVIDYDAETPVSEITRLTNDEYYDYLPVSAYDDVTGDRAVYFVKTASNGSAIDMSNSYTNDCVVVYMLWSDPENDGEGRWLFDYYYDDEVGSEEEKLELIEYWNGQRFLASPIPELGIDVPNISDFAVTTYNGLAVFAYTIDQDSSNDTSFDKELFVQFYDFETHKTYMPVRLTDDNVSDAIPQFVRVGSGEEAYTAVFWYRNEKEIAYVDITDLVRNGVDENGQILDEYMNKDGITTLDRIYSYVEVKSDDSQGNKSMADFKPVVDGENIYIVWTQTAEGKNEGDLCREVFATALIHPEEDVAEDAETTIGCAWANPYRLTYSYANTDEPAVAIDTNGNMMVLYNQYNQEITEDPEKPVVISDFKLKASYMEPCGCVDVENITVSDETPVAGDTVTVEFEAVNNGLTYAAGYTIEVYAEKDGQSELIETIDTDANMLPGQVDNYMVEWTVPEGIEGYVISTDSYEKGGDWTNHSYAASEPFISRAEYEVTNVYVVQDGNNFNISYDVENTGNAESTNDDIYNVVLVGPYCDTFGCTEEECIFAEVPMGGIGVGETKSYTEKLDVPLHIFEKYGYVNCLAVAVDKDNKQLIDGEDVRIAATEPLNLMLNGNEYPTEIIMSVGETINLDVSCTPASISNKLETVFASENSDVAMINGTTITANEAGTTIISGSSNTYGEVIPDIAVTVIDGSGYTVRNVNEGVIITEYIGDSADRIVIPATIDGKPVVGIDDFAFGSIDDEVVISVPDTLMSEYIGDEAFMTYEIINKQLVEMSGGTTVNEVLKYWLNEVGNKNYTDEEIAQVVARILSKVENANGLSMQEIMMYIIKNIDEFGFSQSNLDNFDLLLSCMSYDAVTLEGVADTAAQEYAATKVKLEYLVVENIEGDVTLDSVVNLYDVIAIAQYIMDKEMYPLTDQAMTNGDVTHDGNLNLYDAVEIAKAIMAS